MKMKSIVMVVLATMALSAVSLADTNPPDTNPLGPIMKDIAKNFLPIVKAGSNTAQYAALAPSVDTILGDISQARAIMPDIVSALPAAQQQGQMSAFQTMMDQLNAAFVQLKVDLLSGSASAVATDVTNIGTLKTNGHNQFNPQS